MKTWMIVLFVFLMGGGIALSGETSVVQLSREQFNLMRDTADELDDLAERINALRDKLRIEQERLKDTYKQTSEAKSAPPPVETSTPAPKPEGNRKPGSESSHIVYVTTDWCFPCQRIKPYIEELKKDGYDVKDWTKEGREKGETADIFVVNFDKVDPNNKKKLLGIDANITLLPTFVKVNKDGEVDRKTGYMTKEQFVDYYFEHKKK